MFLNWGFSGDSKHLGKTSIMASLVHISFSNFDINGFSSVTIHRNFCYFHFLH